MDKNRKTIPSPVSQFCDSPQRQSIRELLTMIGDKWSAYLIVTLSKAPGQRARFSELEKMLAGISQRMLTTTLRNLERDGLIKREVFPQVPPRVDYELTDLGRSLLTPLHGLAQWTSDQIQAIQENRGRFDERKRMSAPSKDGVGG